MKINKFLQAAMIGLIATQVMACSVEASSDGGGDDDPTPQESQKVQTLVISDSTNEEAPNTVFFSNRSGDFEYSFDYRAPRNEEIYSLSAGYLTANCDINDSNMRYEVYELTSNGREIFMYRVFSMDSYLRLYEDKTYRFKIVYSNTPSCMSYTMSFWTFSEPF